MKNTDTEPKASARPENVRNDGLAVGTVVKYSGHALKPKRDWWLSCGREPMKSGAKEALDAMAAKRGEIETFNNSRGTEYVTVRWYDGGASDCLNYMIQPVNP